MQTPPLLTQEQAAKYLVTAEATLENWRCNRRYDLPYIKVGRLVRYRLADLEKFLADNTVGAEQE